ncbi:MAG: hypothetical protein KAH30_04820 [Caldisericia bacterium]|nr:hypothetical protein [Caldisericia bacterium]
MKLTSPSKGYKLSLGVGINLRWELEKPLKGAIEVRLIIKGENRIVLANYIFYSMSFHGEMVLSSNIFFKNIADDPIDCTLEYKFISITKEYKKCSIDVGISRYPALNHITWVDNHKKQNQRRPVIFIHGLNPTFPGGEDKVWDSMLNNLSREGIDLFKNFKPFLFNYDSSDVLFAGPNTPGIFQVGNRLGKEIERLKTNRTIDNDNIFVVAHSMGGLVARAVMTYTKHNIERLITLATPHHGTPVASVFKGYLNSNFIREISWDNYDGFYENDKTPNRFLKKMNGFPKNVNNEVFSKIIAFAGKIENAKSSPIKLLNPLRIGLDYFKQDNDGAVPVKSALFDGAHRVRREIFIDVDHFDICKAVPVIDKLIYYLREAQ